MRFLFCFLALALSVSAFATSPPQLTIKNQYGEQSTNTVLGGNFASGAFVLQTQVISAAGALSVTIAESQVKNTTSGTYAVTLAAPTADGQLKIVAAIATMTHTVTLACTNIKFSGAYTPTGTTTLTFTNAGDSAVFISVGLKWVYLGGSAVAS
jgi:hypothetical protein